VELSWTRIGLRGMKVGKWVFIQLFAGGLLFYCFYTANNTVLIPDLNLNEPYTYEVIPAYENEIYKITANSGKKYIYRKLKDLDLERFLREVMIGQYAGELGISPKSYGHDPQNFSQLIEYIEAKNWPLYEENGAPYHQAIDRIKRFHETISETGENAQKKYIPYSQILEEGSKLLRENQLLPNEFQIGLNRIKIIYEKMLPWLEEYGTICHGDFHRENVLWDGERTYIIDWEDARWGDPYFDIAKFGLKISKERRIELFKDYLGHEPIEFELNHIEMIEISMLMLVAINRMQLARTICLNSNQQGMSEEAMKQLLQEESLPSYLEIPFGKEIEDNEKSSIYALSEFLKRTTE
jgi:thiamine kinase-like enzyme